MQLYQHQKDAIRAGITKKKYAIYHEQGLGKSLTAIAIAKFSVLKESIDEIYIVCPAFLKHNWAAEIEKFQPDLLLNFKIFSYEMFMKIPAAVRNKIQFLIVDEAHYIRNRKTLRTNAVVTTSMTAKRVLLLTGTPVGNSSILDLYTHLVCLNHRHPYAQYRAFFKEFADKLATRGGFPIIRAKNETKFLEIISEYSERKTKIDCLDLPDKVYVEIPAKGTKVQQDTHIIHKLMAQEGFSFEVTHPDTGAVIQTFEEHEQKLNILLDLLETLDGAQVTIFCAFRKSIPFIMDGIKKKLKAKCVAFYGELSDEKRIQIIDDFRSNRAQYLVATMQALNAGVTLVNCHNVVYYSRSFSCIERAQSEDRFHRIGQVNKVTYYDIVANGFDKKAFDLINSRQSYDNIKKQLECYED